MKICAQCSAPIVPRYKNSAAKVAAALYCSRSCANASRRPPVAEIIFNDSVRDPDTGCWNWTEYLDPKGYGRLSETNGEVLAHRVSWAYFNKQPVPEGMHVLHKCDNRRCINPEHLMIGTNLDNHYDKMAKGRQRGAVGVVNGRAKLSDEQVKSIMSDPRRHRDIADAYGVSPSAVSHIKNGNTWTHVFRKSA